MPKLPVLRLNKNSRETNPATAPMDSAADVETPAIRRARRHIERLEREKAQLLERIAQREQAIQDQRWMAVIRQVAPGWSLETVAGGLAAAFAECREDPTYFDEITTFGKTLISDGPEKNL